MKIVLSDHCFGSDAYVDDIDLSESEEGLFDPKTQKDARKKILSQLSENIDSIPNYYWKELAEMVIHSNLEFERDEEGSSSDTCEQCGNWNTYTVYINKNTKE
jgi:hypothetical protein